MYIDSSCIHLISWAKQTIFSELIVSNAPVVGGINIRLHHANDITLVNWIDVPFANSMFRFLPFSFCVFLVAFGTLSHTHTFRDFSVQASLFGWPLTGWMCVMSNASKLWIASNQWEFEFFSCSSMVLQCKTNQLNEFQWESITVETVCSTFYMVKNISWSTSEIISWILIFKFI